MEGEQLVQLGNEDCEDIEISPNEEGKITVEEVETQTDRTKIIHIKAGTTVRESLSVLSNFTTELDPDRICVAH